MPAEVVVLDDRLLIEELLVGLPRGRRRPSMFTTSYWYHRACRAAVSGAGGHLAGPFEQLAAPEQERAILSLLELRKDIRLPDPRSTVPAMADTSRRHAQLNLLNLEAVAAAQLLNATVWLSPPAANGVLLGVLDSEGLPWEVISLATAG
ncbi:MAG: hypothetical protein HYX34_09305 [Actinobacteria bacterium]|nr:hypothetical protein [Actinomycetota bacterium]